MPWWLHNDLRMVQYNLRDMDAALDIDALIASLIDLKTNTVMVGAAGISAFYPTTQPFQKPSPYLKDDFLSALCARCHEKGIRVIARFDFSKIHESIAKDHPDWCYRDIHGEAARFQDTVQTCPCGTHQQKNSLAMIGEVLHHAPVDGIFFNMFGFNTHDYAGVYHGICQCEACKAAFRAYCGLSLPQSEKADEPALPTYRAFQQKTVRALLESIRAFVKAIDPEVAICTYSPYGVDIVRNESNSAVDRPLPFWLYSASENCQLIQNGWQGCAGEHDRIVSNCAINAVDIFYRFQGVSPHLTRLRLFQNLAEGSGLDFCTIGPFQGYPDQAGIQAAKEIFHLHARHENCFGHFRSQAKLLLLRPDPSLQGLTEYKGLYRLLKEEHRLFDVTPLEHGEALCEHFSRYDAILLPEIRRITPPVLEALRASGAALLATGLPFADMENGTALRREIFGVLGFSHVDSPRSAYVQTLPKTVFEHFPDRNWVFAESSVHTLTLDADTQGLLPLVAPAPYGPPERCFGHVETQEPTASRKGRNALLALPLGTLYEKLGYEDHKWLVLDLLKSLRQTEDALETDAPRSVEVGYHSLPDGTRLLTAANLTGFNGTGFSTPVPLHDLHFRIRDFTPKAASLLTAKGETPLPLQNETLTLPQLAAYSAVLLK